MIERHVNCIQRSQLTGQHEHITHIGNKLQGWRLSREQAILRIETLQEAYYTVHPATGERIYLAVVRESGKPAYLRSCINGRWSDHLQALEACSTKP